MNVKSTTDGRLIALTFVVYQRQRYFDVISRRNRENGVS